MPSELDNESVLRRLVWPGQGSGLICDGSGLRPSTAEQRPISRRGRAEARWVGAKPSGPGGLSVAGARSGGEEAAGADHVVRQRVPEPDRLGLLEAADEEAQQATVAALGVDAFGGGGALPVDRLGRLAAHALAPSRHAGAAALPW